MNWRHSSLIFLVLVALLVAACGPLPTDSAPPGETDTAAETNAPTEAPATAQEENTPAPATAAPEPGPADVDPDDYHVLGAPDAPVTIVEYSDFQ